MNIKEKLETEEIQQAIYKFALDITEKDQSEFTPEQFVLNKANSEYTKFELKSNDRSKQEQRYVIVEVDHETENVKVFEQNIDKDEFDTKGNYYVGRGKLSEILKKYDLSKEDYKESLDEINEEIEQNQYKEFFKGQVLSNIEEKETAKEKWQYKERFKAGVLKLLNVEPKEPMKHVKKEDDKANHDKNVKAMKEFEKSHSVETIYQLRKEAFKELKELDLTESQKEKLIKLEKNLDKQKQEYDKNINKTNSSKEINEKKNEKQKKKSVEMER
ncbi:hypothetical protein [Bacillus thuringiensis]|uniref:hypothetical protein n=1 Tax=Bacillus thuringiensis TaxID=1428 RepID=UPI000BF7110E|nr:hypothetical protein [Bacillus thuringiensis]PFJ12021.1 hypothetical protein COI87_10420 [Bacillus thuringiensis]